MEKHINKKIEELRKTTEDVKKCENKITKLRNDEVKALLFDKYLIKAKNIKEGNSTIKCFLKR